MEKDEAEGKQMQQDRAGAEFQHGACASTLPSPNKILMDVYKKMEKREKKLPARGYFMEK